MEGDQVGMVEEAPRSASRLVLDTFGHYRRYPWLFFVLAAGVIVPYEALVLAFTGTGPLARSELHAQASLLLMLADLALIGPLVSALHVHAVRKVREGGNPDLGSVARQGLRVLPVVAAATIISWLGITVGFIALIVPGVYLSLRWFVVAQAAAIERRGWMGALRRSGELTEGHYGHVFVVLIYVTLITTLPVLAGGWVFSDDPSGVVSSLVGTVVQIFAYSFGALLTALVYFDLCLRQGSSPSPQPSPSSLDS